MHYILKLWKVNASETLSNFTDCISWWIHYVPFQALHPLIMSWCLEYYQVLSRNKIRSFLKLETKPKAACLPIPGATSNESQCTMNGLILSSNLLLIWQFSLYKSMRNTLQVNSISVEVHWHMLQMAVSEKQLPPSSTEDVYSAHKGKMQDNIEWETF